MATSAATLCWLRRFRVGVPCADTSTGASSWRHTPLAASRTPTKRLTLRSQTIFWKLASGFSCAAVRRRPHGTACRRRSGPSRNWARIPSGCASAPTTATRTTCSRSGWTGWSARRSRGGPASRAGMEPRFSLHPATRYGMDGEIGGLGGGRRADLVLLDDDHGGLQHLVWRRTRPSRIVPGYAPFRRSALSKPYRYPASAYRTVNCPETTRRWPFRLPRPVAPPTSSAPRLPGILLYHDRVRNRRRHRLVRRNGPHGCMKHGLCFVAVIERHGKSGAVAHGSPERFQPKATARWRAASDTIRTTSSSQAPTRPICRSPIAALRATQGGVCVVEDGQVSAMVELPIAGFPLRQARLRGRPRKPRRLKTGVVAAGLHAAVHGVSTSSRCPSSRKSASLTRGWCWCRR